MSEGKQKRLGVETENYLENRNEEEQQIPTPKCMAFPGVNRTGGKENVHTLNAHPLCVRETNSRSSTCGVLFSTEL